MLLFFPLGAILAGGEKKKPTACFASGGGLETLFRFLEVSPLARNGRNRRDHSRGNRLGRRGHGALVGDGNHTSKNIAWKALNAKVKIV